MGVKTLNMDRLNQLLLVVRIPIGDTRFNIVRIAYDFPSGISGGIRIV